MFLALPGPGLVGVFSFVYLAGALRRANPLHPATAVKPCTCTRAASRGYLTGFVLAAILTIIPFWLVMGHVFDSHWLTITLVLLLAIARSSCTSSTSSTSIRTRRAAGT